MFRNWPLCTRVSIRQIFKLHKGGITGHPLKLRPAGPKPKCSSICAQDAGSRAICSSPGAGSLAIVETHKSPRGVKGVKKERKGKEVPPILKGDQKGVRHRKRREGGSLGKGKRVVISKGAQYHNSDAVTRLIGPRNIARVEVNGVKTRALMDSGLQVNMVTPVYTDLKPGSSKVKVLVTNDSNKPVQLPAKMVIRVVSTVNVVPAMIAPKTMLEKDWDQSRTREDVCN